MPDLSRHGPWMSPGNAHPEAAHAGGQKDPLSQHDGRSKRIEYGIYGRLPPELLRQKAPTILIHHNEPWHAATGTID